MTWLYLMIAVSPCAGLAVGILLGVITEVRPSRHSESRRRRPF